MHHKPVLFPILYPSSFLSRSLSLSPIVTGVIGGAWLDNIYRYNMYNIYIYIFLIPEEDPIKSPYCILYIHC